MTNKRCVTERVKMCICTICFCMCVVYFVFWYVKHRLKKKKKTDLPTLFFFLCYANQTIFFFTPYSKLRSVPGHFTSSIDITPVQI